MKNFAEYFIDHETMIDESLVPVGYPVEDTEILLLDDDGRPVGAGEIGEIVVKSRFIAPSYWRQPELTQATFQPAPGGGDERLYRTGDLGRQRPDGALVHLGRKDLQVKIRGYRIEIGEIENALLALAGVSSAVVVAREDQPGDRRLVAYLVLSAGAGPQIGAWRAALAAKLPEYMIPASFVVLESLPLTSTGKVDRAKLPQPDRDRPLLETPYMEPCSQLERVLATFWAEVLGLDMVGTHDDFNALGGDSLRGARLLSTVKAVFGVDLPFELLLRDAATVAGMTRAIEAARSKAAADERRANSPSGMRRPTSIPRRPERQAAHLSDTQRRMWFLARLDPAHATYNQSLAYRLIGDIDVEALKRSVRLLARRHEILRTTYSLGDDEPRQVVHEDLKVELKCADLGALPKPQQSEAMQCLMRGEMQQAFNLETSAPLRMLLVRLDEREHVLLRVIHHIASDGWSIGIFERELSAGYAAFAKGTEPALPALAIQYADYAVWQREWLQGEVLEEQLAYWKSQLANVSTLELPADRPRPPVASDRGAHLIFELPAPLTAALKALGQREGATLFMTLLAAFQVLLYRYSGQQDIAVGAPIAGRRHTELEGLIGFFANTLVLRTDLSGNPPFRELLARVREIALGAYTHQDLPFEKLVEELAPARDLSRNPLFQVMFALQNAPGAALALEGLEVSRLPLAGHSAKFDLSLSVRESAEGLRASWEYATDLFDASTIERMARHFERLLEAIVADPQQRIAQLPLLSAAERHQLLVEWNDTAADYPKDRCIHELFEAQAARTPEAVAVVFEGRQLTYGELNARANQLAHYCIEIGVGRDVLVGLCMERSLELIVGLVGILKAGGAYVPLDPSYPKNRLAFMLNDTQAPVLLTQQGLLEQLPKYDERIVCLDRDWLHISAHSVANAATNTDAEALAYVMYTSGSTGNAKGVMIGHRALVNHMTWMEVRFPLVATDRVLQKTSIGGDASVWELFAPLISGAQLVLAAPQVHRSPSDLVETAQRQAITVLQVVPSMLAAMLDESGLSQCRALRRLYCGGEVLGAEAARRFRARSSAELMNLYGPTEATIDATCHVCLEDSDQTVSIGRPIANTRIYLLDGHGEPVPVGVPGELYIGGAGLARGYLNRPELTAEKFLPDPFSEAPGARMYRTGDLARYLPDGNIEFLGRIDHQVKVRGFRIELGEIEAVLAEHAAVRQAVVLAREDVPGDKRLVAYVVPADASFTDTGPLRAFLRVRLPDYMLPAAYVLLERLPLTPNDKVDRRALPAPHYGRDEAGDTFVPPRNALEETIAEVWCEVLELDRVGVHDNFFELGGHSLLSAQVLARLTRLLPVELPLRRIFEAPTIAELAQDVARISEGADETKLERILHEVEALTDEEAALRLNADWTSGVMPR
jgi:amino acid adenylation domain-containing protein